MSQALTLSFRSDTEQARTAIANLASSVVSNMLTIGSAMKTAADNAGKMQAGIAAIPNVLRGAVAGFVAFEAIKFTLDSMSKASEAAREKLAAIVKVANDATNTGVGSNFLQQWKAQADALNISAEKLVGMLQRARDASTVNLGTNGNPNQSEMQNLLGRHVSAGNISGADLDAFNAAKSQEERNRVILDLIDKLMAASRTLAGLNIAQGMFGKDFENQMRNGVNMTQQMRDAMKSTKDVAFPPDVVARGKEINDQLNEADKKMREGWLPIQQDILRWQQDELASWANIKTAIAGITVVLGGWYTAVKKAMDAIPDLGNAIGRVWLDAEKNMPDWYKAIGRFGAPQIQMLTDADRQKMIEERKNPRKLPELTVTPDDKSGGLGGGTKTTARQTSELETYMNQLQKSVAVLEAETTAYGKNNTAKEEAVAMARAEEAARRDADNKKRESAQLSDEERQKVLREADALGRLKDAQEANQKATERANFAGEQLLGIFDRIGQKGTTLRSIIEQLGRTLLHAVEQAALLGTGPFGGGLLAPAGGAAGGLIGLAFRGAGSLFGGGGMSLAEGELGQAGPGFLEAAAMHSGGGWAGTGPRALVPAAMFAGARRYADGGGIGIIAHPGELILNAAQQKNVVGNMGGGTTVHYSPTINGSDLTKEQLAAVLNAHGNQLVSRIQRNFGPMQADYARRHG